MKHKKLSLTKLIKKSIHLRYLLYLPGAYEKKPKKRWPLIIFLHGSEERGDNLKKITHNGLPKLIEEGKEFPFIVVSPLCPRFINWVGLIDELYNLIQEISNKFRVDNARISVTGLSMGGTGAWYLGVRHPELFAAIIPISGDAPPMRGFPFRVKVLKDIPVWVFHGALDDVVPIKYSARMVDALKKYKGRVHFTVYPYAGHDAWSQTYRNPKFYKWLLKQKKSR
ncbi:MAG: prolyl oligopeptidase family serine peptidase [Spirochaetes bacterium]|nr:prolyl oligopeptidase family serine peptidase [Spirochaetota bacterium]